MHFYSISSGEYSDYCSAIMYHEKKFSNKEFVAKYNEALEELQKDTRMDEDVAEKMIEMFGFKEVVIDFEINAAYDAYKVIDLDMITEDFKFIDTDELDRPGSGIR